VGYVSLIAALLGWYIASGACYWRFACNRAVGDLANAIMGVTGEGAAFVGIDLLVATLVLVVVGLLTGFLSLRFTRSRSIAWSGLGLTALLILYHVAGFIQIRMSIPH